MDEKPRLILPSENGVVNLEVRRMQAKLEPKKSPATESADATFESRADKVFAAVVMSQHVIRSGGSLTALSSPDGETVRVSIHTCEGEDRLAFLRDVRDIIDDKIREFGGSPEGA